MKLIRGGLTAGVLVLTTAACSAGGGGASGDAAARIAESPKPTVSAAQIAIEPKTGASDVKPSGALKVSVASGKLS
ncbi:hypothetical protein UK12_32635, partial [Saccharothrix sp. ST-888]